MRTTTQSVPSDAEKLQGIPADQRFGALIQKSSRIVRMTGQVQNPDAVHDKIAVGQQFKRRNRQRRTDALQKSADLCLREPGMKRRKAAGVVAVRVGT